MSIKRGIDFPSSGGCVLDWLSFTVPWDDGAGLRWAEESFGPLGSPGAGQRGYNRSCTIFESGCVCWHDSLPSQGVFVRLPATALGLMSCLDSASMRDPLGLLRYIRDSGAHFTRVDFAFDDRSGLLDLDVMSERVMAGAYTSRWHQVTEVRDLAGGSGHSLRFGSRVSDTFLRIYDKAAERAAHCELVDGSWVRVEIELHGDVASAMVDKVLDGVGVQIVRDWLAEALSFRDDGGGDSNVSRWPVAVWWSEFVGKLAKAVQLSLPLVRSTLERRRRWLERAVARVFASVAVADSGGSWVDDFCALGLRRLTAQDEVMIRCALA